MAAAPTPRNHESRYASATRTFARTPASVTAPPGTRRSSSADAPTDTSSRSRSFWLGRSPSTRSNTSVATGHEVRMRDPGPIEAVARFALLVVADLGQRDLGDGRVAAVRDERRHPADGVRPASMAGLDEELRVRPHERHGHRQLGAIRDRQVGPGAELLDAAEQVVPAPGIEPRGMLAQLEQDLVHLEGGQDRLDQDGRPDAPARDPERRLAVDEDLVPEPRLVMALELGEVEVRTAAEPKRLGAVVEEEQPEVEQAGRDRRRRRPASPTRPGASPAVGPRASPSDRLAGTPCPRAIRR